MKNKSAKRERFLRDEPAVRLGNIAANLARIGSFSDNPHHGRAVAEFMEESRFFIELAAPSTGSEQQEELMRLHGRLSEWQSHWDEIWNDPGRRAAMAREASSSSELVLAMSRKISWPCPEK